MSRTPQSLAEHPIGKLCGVTTQDSRVEAAEKAIATMRLAGFSRKHIAEAERTLAAAKARGVK